MTVHSAGPDTSPTYWTAMGVSIGPGLGLLAGLLISGSDGIAVGLCLGAGVGVALGAARDGVVRRSHDRDGEDPTPRE
jgi:hypothetical protein